MKIIRCACRKILTLQKQTIKRRRKSVPDTAAMTMIVHDGSSSAIIDQ